MGNDTRFNGRFQTFMAAGPYKSESAFARRGIGRLAGGLSSDLLFTPTRLGALQLPHRVLMAPLTRCRAEPGHVPGPLMAEYYRQRASAGLIIAEATAVPQSRPKIYSCSFRI